MGFLVAVIVGAIAGWLAGLVVKGTGFGLIGDIVIGIIGGFVGDWLAGELQFSLGSGIISDILISLIGAVVLLLIIKVIKKAL